MADNLISIISKDKKLILNPKTTIEREDRTISPNHNIPIWRPSIFSTYGAYVLAEIDYLLNYTGIFNYLEYTGIEDYEYFLTSDEEGMGEYFRYRFPAAQGTIIAHESKERGNPKKTYQYNNPKLTPYEQYSTLVSRLPQSYRIHIITSPPNDLSIFSIYLLIALQTALDDSSPFLVPVENNLLGENIIKLVGLAYKTIYLIQPLFSSTAWLYAVEHIERFDHALLESNLNQLSGKNILSSKNRKKYTWPQARDEDDQIALSIDWKLPGPIDQRYQTTCPSVIRIRQRKNV